MEKVEAADDETREQASDRNAEKEEQNPKQTPRILGLREEIETQTDQRDGNGDECHQSNEPVENHRQQGSCFFIRRFFEQQIAFNDIPAGSTWQKLIVKHSNQKQAGYSCHRQANSLHP